MLSFERTTYVTCSRVATNLENMENLETQGIWKIVKFSGKTQGNLNFCRKNLENSGKIKICDMIANKNALIEFFSLELLKEKV